MAFQCNALSRVIVEPETSRMRTASRWLHVFTIMNLGRRKNALINTVGGSREDRAHEDYHQRGALALKLMSQSRLMMLVGPVRVMPALCFASSGDTVLTLIVTFMSRLRSRSYPSMGLPCGYRSISQPSGRSRL